MSAPLRLFVFGLGYSAGAFARAMRGETQWIGGTVRAPDKAERLRTEGIDARTFDGQRPGSIAERLSEATHLLVSIAPRDGDPVLAHHRTDITAARKLQWIGYLSTVGVYGNYGGAWVSERTTPHPARGRSAERLKAEKAWTKLAGELALPIAIFRIAGIYGPGRNALVNLAEGKARRIVKPGQVFNRVHVDDIVSVLAAAARSKAEGIFNLADDEPAPPQDVVAFAAGLMGIDPPPETPFAEADLSPMARSFYGESRRVANNRIKRDLGVTLRYPTYREGLTAMWTDGSWRAR